MEAWREELYHSLSDLRKRINSSTVNKKVTSGKTKSIKSNGTGKEWKSHKYIRKVNGRYVYPEDLHKKSKSASNKKANTSSASVKKTTKVSSKKYNTASQVIDDYLNTTSVEYRSIKYLYEKGKEFVEKLKKRNSSKQARGNTYAVSVLGD